MDGVEQRHARLLAIVARRGRAELRELAFEMRVSMATIRRDVTKLAALGHVVRSYGEVSIAAPIRGDITRGAIGIIAMNPGLNGYQGAVVDAVRQEAERRRLRCIIEVGEGEATERLLRSMVEGGCAGVVYMPRWVTAEDEDVPVPWLLEAPIPVVMADRLPEWPHPLFDLDAVVTDHRVGLLLALQHLVDLGHERVLSVIRNDSPTARRLRRHDADVRAQLGLARLTDPLHSPRNSEDPAMAVADIIKQLRATAATALFVHNDSFAQLLVGELATAGIAVPEECSVVAYDDYIGPGGTVPLTSVAPAKQDIGREAVSLIARRRQRTIDGLTNPRPAHLQLVPGLTVRASTAPPG